MNKYELIYIVGIGLLILGGVSGIALFFRAASGKEKSSEGLGMGTLWGLFIIGILAGIIIITAVD